MHVHYYANGIGAYTCQAKCDNTLKFIAQQRPQLHVVLINFLFRWSSINERMQQVTSGHWSVGALHHYYQQLSA